MGQAANRAPGGHPDRFEADPDLVNWSEFHPISKSLRVRMKA